ncbi:hypothetical protein [Nesterenkonia alkaliphila]|uniref:Uncharacterized protein n=1 Tax=Nesterenkonia alkaliphila TaxID=1463631 RepID=A0A7K1UF94_9MICC|nr:hypothetical protein [Nesterenkonia alkaliphila]MVT25119.1 hypothetical protein [Nesterenkonia alkaliphila]
MGEAGLPADLTPRSWEQLSARKGRADKPALLVDAVSMGILSDPREFRIALEDTWTATEWPGRAATTELWLTLFQMVLEPGTYLDDTELLPISELPATLPVYRAATAGYEDGLSWTTSLECAHWFATRLGAASGRSHRIYEMDAPRETVLAFFHASRNEHEYVIDTSRLKPATRREVLPEEWEYLLGRPLERPRQLGASAVPGAGICKLDDGVSEAGQEGLTRAEAVGLVLRMSEGLTEEATVAALESVESRYRFDAPDQRVSHVTLTDTIAAAHEGYRP